MNESVWELKQKLHQEKVASERIAKSLKQWEHITSDVCTGVTNVSTSSHEWQIRFECQYQYNKTLKQQIQRMRAEIRMLRNGNELPESLDAMKQMRTVGDWRRQIKDLSVEKCSLKSLQNMYETQLDTESMVYYRARDELHKLTKDVRNTFEATIHEQELADRKEIPAIPLTNSPRKQWNKLKPIAKIIPFKKQNQGKGKSPHNYMNIFHNNRQVEQSHNGATFSGLVEIRPESLRENSDPIPENSRVLTENSVPFPENSYAIPENSDHVPEKSGSITEASVPIPENSGRIPENSYPIL